MRFISALFLLLALPSLAWAQDDAQITNQTAYSYSSGVGVGTVTMSGLTVRSQLVDPRGAVMGCGGALLPSYQGFQIGLYAPDPADPTGAEVKGAIVLTPTAFPAAPRLPAGVAPNSGNINPFPLSDTDKGRFSFLFDPSRGQLDPGKVYILVLSPPPGSAYRERRIRITINARDAQTLTYTATSLDGEPVSGMAGQMTAAHTVVLQAATQGLVLAALNLTLTDCSAHPISITKTGDRDTAEPGDDVIYRITIQNATGMPLGNLQIRDTLPIGFDLREDSLRAAVAGKSVPLALTRSGGTALMDAGALILAPGQTLTLAYAAQLTPDALRGDGKNSAVALANALLTRNGTTTATPVSDGPAVFGIAVRQGLLTDTGTIIGRVWIDRSRDGEQQRGEPGLPGAVVILDDSTRIVADANGLFSVPTVTAGYHAAALDMQSVPGYTLARNHRFRERNSQSRLVHLQPGGLVRLNFGVVPILPAIATPAKGGAK